MSSSRWEKIESLFEQAAALDAPARDGFLDGACPDDPDLRDEVRSLLSHDYAATPDFLRPPPAEPGLSGTLRQAAGPDLLMGQRIGRYQIKSLIAAGGMGAVYEAEQDYPHRIVALKVMRPDLGTRSAVRRFQFEAEVLARLRHPHIAQIYDAGMHGNGPEAVAYFAMEYIPGARSITQYAAEQKLNVRHRLELFARVCDAAAHGHQKAVLHRDFKPANILVDASGDPKVIDFGVARTTDSDVAVTTMRTDVGQLIGTLAYMSPEQCEGDPHELDVRTDVYSLGVVLYELLCGRPPYEVSRTSIYSAVKTIKEATPDRPSTLDRKLRGDLEAIVLKAIEKDKQKRYASVADLASDIRRYLAGEPIAARKPTVWLSTVRWMARHPALTASAGATAITVVVLIAVITTIASISANRPARIELNATRSEARLTSWFGLPIAGWNGRNESAIAFAEMVTSPPEFGQKRLAIIGFTEASAIFPRSVCAFEIGGDPNKPYWQRVLIVNEQTAPKSVLARGELDWNFSPRVALVADIFPESPGDELVLDFGHERSHAALRIYDLRGRLLFQVWNDGGIGAKYWMSKPRLLICCGGNELIKDQAKGWPAPANKCTMAPVLFAIRPVMDQLSNADPSMNDFRLGCEPVWYRYLIPPPTESLYFDAKLSNETGTNASESFVRLKLTIRQPPTAAWAAGMSLIVGENGDEVVHSRRVSDVYNRYQNQLPAMSVFRLSKQPPTPADVWTPPPASNDSKMDPALQAHLAQAKV